VPKPIRVVGAVIVRAGLVLCAQRGPTGHLPGLWEFPGGKAEPGEFLREALEREIREELECTVAAGNEVTTTTHDYDFAEVTLTTFYCHLISGEPQPTEHACIKWLPPDELYTIDWAPADIPALALIQAGLG